MFYETNLQPVVVRVEKGLLRIDCVVPAIGPDVVQLSGSSYGNSFASGRPDLVGNPDVAGSIAANATCTAPSSIHNFTNWFNPCAFALVPTNEARPGNSPNGSVRGPGLQRWDLSLFKNTKITERVTTQFRAEAFNVFNHTNLDSPDPYFGTGLFSQILNVRDPRILQLALKLYF
jgi:hypothetical protein